jgi:hypothetical protein
MSKKLIRLNPKPNIFTFIHERAPGRWATKKNIAFIICPKLLGRKNFNYPKNFKHEDISRVPKCLGRNLKKLSSTFDKVPIIIH